MAQSEIYSDRPPFLIARNSEAVMRAYSLATYCFLLSYHELLEVYQPFLFRSQTLPCQYWQIFLQYLLSSMDLG